MKITIKGYATHFDSRYPGNTRIELSCEELARQLNNKERQELSGWLTDCLLPQSPEPKKSDTQIEDYYKSLDKPEPKCEHEWTYYGSINWKCRKCGVDRSNKPKECEPDCPFCEKIEKLDKHICYKEHTEAIRMLTYKLNEIIEAINQLRR